MLSPGMRPTHSGSQSAPSANTLTRIGKELSVSGVINLDTVTGLAEKIKPALTDGVRVLDLSEVTQVDSSAISLLILILGIANDLNIPVEILGLNKSISSLMELYSVKGFFSIKQD